MRAVQVEQPGGIRIVAQPRPEPQPGEVRVRITRAGICGTDLHLYNGAFGNFPMTPGHDLAGVIESVGSNVEAQRIGQRVTIDPAACCARAAVVAHMCPACRQGDTHLCSHRTYMGISAPGGMAEYIVVPSRRAIALPESVDDDTATVLEPVVVALHLMEKISDRPGPALILGGGPIGIVAALMLQNEGRDVWLSEPLGTRQATARTMGIHQVLQPDKFSDRHPAKVIVETSGHPSAADTISNVAAPGSTIVLVGGDTPIDAILILTRELEIRAAKGGRGLYPEAIACVEANKIQPGKLISHRFSVSAIGQAFEIASRQPDKVMRVVVDMKQW